MFLLLQLLSAACRFNCVFKSQFYNGLVLFSEYRPIWLSSTTFYICCFILMRLFYLFREFLSSIAMFNVQLDGSKLGISSILIVVCYV